MENAGVEPAFLDRKPSYFPLVMNSPKNSRCVEEISVLTLLYPLSYSSVNGGDWI